MNNKTDLINQLRIDRSQEPERQLPWLWISVGVLLLVILGSLLWFFLSPKPVTVSVQTARVSNANPGFASVLDGTGYVIARRYATVSSKVTGKVMEVLVEEGMTVEKDQIVARLDDSNTQKTLALYQAELESAKTQVTETRARLREAELTFKRATELVEKNLASKASLDTARANFESLSAQLATREAGVSLVEKRIAIEEQYLDDLILRAPFAGVVIAKNSQPGEMISPISAGGGFTRTGICTLVDMSSLEIEVDVNEAYIQRVSPGQPVQATLEAYPDWRIPARVIAIIPTADRQKATVRVRVGFEQLDPRILPDMGVKVAFLNTDSESSTTQATPVIRIPSHAVRTENGERVAYVVKDNRAERRVLSLGQAMNGEFPVMEGLKPGESFVVNLPKDLSDGARVQLK